ncbi:uncharacterized protein LOC136032816 isoform X2 [Artemia franciscana]|uniref:Uncharacterized protein n=1 Tax=Artemia franciscana TaxID=6661 RepID=A0AA88IAT0_ARTSF|nr:hypothetical protein QYM36_001489 [Artemia franciscana]
MLYIIFLLAFTEVNSQTERDAILRKNEAIIVYPIKGERDLPYCSNELGKVACNIIQQRFWFPSIAYRQCRCQDRSECDKTPTRYGRDDNSVESSVFLSSGAELKFCDSLKDLPECKVGEIGLEIYMSKSADKLSDTNPKPGVPAKISLHCKPNDRYYQWRKTYDQHINKTMDKTYAYEHLTKCKLGNFCGYISRDTFSTYYKCQCPSGQMCLPKEQSQLQSISEVLFEGFAYEGFCSKVRGFDD